MRALLNKIFLPKLGTGKFVLSAFAFLVGLTLVLLALQGYRKISELIDPQKNASSYVIINKEVALLHTLLGGKAQFTEEEITDLKRQPFVSEVGLFRSSKFRASASIGGDMGFSTELFFESVPSQFIDGKPSNFIWHQDQNFLPIIISQDFLNLYNFGYALGRGTPQLSQSTIQFVPLTVEISGAREQRVFQAKVVGFSERLSSILVPEEFLAWANKEVGKEGDSQSVSRIIIKVKDNKVQSMETYFKEKNWKINDDKLKFGRLITVINIVMSVLVAIGTAFMLFAMIIVMLNFSLMVAQTREEVSLLIQLGYEAKHLVNHLSIYLWIFMGSVVLLTSVAFIFGNTLLIKFLRTNALSVTPAVSMEVIMWAVGFVLVSILISYYSIYRLIRKQL
jgi:hypothetical protein